MDQEMATQGLIRVEFNELTEAGAYVTEQGSLARVQKEGLKQGHSPLITFVSKDITVLTKISDDPFVSIGKARLLAANADIQPNF